MSDRQKYELEERTAKFGAVAIVLAKQLPPGTVNTPLISQFVRAATSVGGNYSEADDAESKKDFLHKIGICRKEARETKHWLRMLATAEPSRKAELRPLWQEAKEPHLIFAAIVRKGRQ